MVGERLPTTPAQRLFVDVCQGLAGPETEDEHVWRKYRRRVAWEANSVNRSLMGAKRTAADPSWGGSRAAYRDMKRQEKADFFRRQRGG